MLLPTCVSASVVVESVLNDVDVTVGIEFVDGGDDDVLSRISSEVGIIVDTKVEFVKVSPLKLPFVSAAGLVEDSRETGKTVEVAVLPVD